MKKKKFLIIVFLLISCFYFCGNVSASDNDKLSKNPTIYWNQELLKSYPGYVHLGSKIYKRTKWDGLVPNDYYYYYDFIVQYDKTVKYIDAFGSPQLFTRQTKEMTIRYIQTKEREVKRTLTVYSTIDVGSACSSSSEIVLWDDTKNYISGSMIEATVSKTGMYYRESGYEYAIGLYQISSQVIAFCTCVFTRGSLLKKSTYVVEDAPVKDNVILGYIPLAVDIYADYKNSRYFKKIYNQMQVYEPNLQHIC